MDLFCQECVAPVVGEPLIASPAQPPIAEPQIEKPKAQATSRSSGAAIGLVAGLIVALGSGGYWVWREAVEAGGRDDGNPGTADSSSRCGQCDA